jgi:long-subunit acyl-CoA synthetase (AMP-forming)/ribosomal protein S18 acetylase RimI-like enzyme
MVPANAPPEHIALIINESEASILLVHDDRQLTRVQSVRGSLQHLKRIVLVRGASASEGVISLADLVRAGETVRREDIEALEEAIRPDLLATVMYTSGTTGQPKGIIFTHTNIVFKRFCRALALPEIGHGDRFLCYLPLFHTFGRWLEMMGCVFWGATYHFLENPAVETIVESMRRVEPTVFISIPKKWHQLYDVITAHVDPEIGAEEEIQRTVDGTTGGKLRWGLSAAGYLPPEVFRFFQRYGVELMSGFGMTEATGGITMTPPGIYRDNSLGRALPGIEIKLADDGELLVRGAYVTPGYYGSDPSEDFVDGWLPTGDIMRRDAAGFIEIIDRKKEIYKNSRGETIAPQRIENFFSDFEATQQVFLVGDRKPYNTLLIHPAPEAEADILSDMDDEERQAYFASLVVSVNGFLMPYERIVDFRLIDRAFDVEHGELTPKGTYKRRVIGESFHDVIETMYARTFASVVWNGTEIHIPSWFLRENGCLVRDIVATEEGLSIPKLGRRLKLAPADGRPDQLRIGDFVYEIKGGRVDLQRLVTEPLNWLGNFDLFHFVGMPIITWYRAGRATKGLRLVRKAETCDVPAQAQKELTAIANAGERSLFGLHLAVLHLQDPDPALGEAAVSYLRSTLDDESAEYGRVALEIVFRPTLVDSLEVRRGLLRAGLRHMSAAQVQRALVLYLGVDPAIFDAETIRRVVAVARTDEHLAALEDVLAELTRKPPAARDVDGSPLQIGFEIIAQFAVRHPTKLRAVRRSMVQYELQHESPVVGELAARAREQLLEGGRTWFGENKRFAVDIETGEEYQWRDVITFEEGMDPDDKKRILDALTESCVLRESVFFFSGGRIIGLHDLPRGGIWVSHLGSAHGKAVYRVKVQTRHHGSFDLALNLNRDLSQEEVGNEVAWLIVAGGARGRPSLVEEFGGYWPDHQLWSEEYVAGETVARWLRRTARNADEQTRRRLYYLWPYFVWSGAGAYIGLLARTGFRLQLRQPSPDNIIVPPHDYQTGTRIVSISDRVPFVSLRQFFLSLYELFVEATMERYEVVRQDDMWRYVFAGALESEGETDGIEMLRRLRDEPDAGGGEAEATMVERLDRFLSAVGETGYIPKRLHFAIRRFHRWLAINSDAALSAQAQMLRELYETYDLQAVETQHPETRTRFFLETAFAESDATLRGALEDLMRRQHREAISSDELLRLVSSIQEKNDLSERDAYFLARLSYPHLEPTDDATLRQTVSAGAALADLVVQVEDHDGVPFTIRRPVSPKEISRLHQIFFKENLRVEFRPDHRFLVAVSDRGHIIGGLFYLPPDDGVVHMEKIVVSGHFRHKGVGEAIMTEFFNRMHDLGATAVTTGFFRPEYFYRQGFEVAPRYAGLVRALA